MNEDIKRLSVEETLREIKKIHDIDVKNFIFKFDHESNKFLTNKGKLHVYFNNLLIIAFMYLYGKYLVWRKYRIKNLETNPILKKSSNFMRIITSFEKLYADFNLTYEFIENILNDIQILLVSENSTKLMQELDIYGGFSLSNDFSSLMKIARVGRYSERNQIQDIGYLRYMLVQFLQMMPFLVSIDIEHSDLKLNFIENSNKVQFQKLVVSDQKISSYDFDTHFAFLRDVDTEQYYFLETVTQREIRKTKEEYLILTYSEIGEFSSGKKIYILVRNEHSDASEKIDNLYVLEDIDGVNAFKRKVFSTYVESSDSSHFIKDFNTINFRYIRILALAISDILDDEGKKFIFETYSIKNEYRSMFISDINQVSSENYLDNDNFEESGYGWDIVIATLLIEESATKLLQSLFEVYPFYFKRLLENLRYRFKEEDFDINVIESNVKKIISEELLNRRKKMYGNIKSSEIFKKVVDENLIRSRTEAHSIVRKLSELTYANESAYHETKFPLSINSRIKIVEDIERAYGYQNLPSLIATLKNLVTQTLKTLYCFYHSLFAYATVKFKFERESVLNVLTADAVKQSQDEANKKFDEMMKEKSEELSNIANDDVKLMMDKIKELCRICAYPGHQGSYNELLKRMLGREFLLNYINISCLEDCFDEHIDTRIEFIGLTDKIKSALSYLKSGHIEGSNTYDGVIFPYVAFLDYTSKTRDGYDINHFSVISNDGTESDIKVISEYQYINNQSYYCVPNRLRSNDELKLWIEPLVINYNHIAIDVAKGDDETK